MGDFKVNPISFTTRTNTDNNRNSKKDEKSDFQKKLDEELKKKEGE